MSNIKIALFDDNALFRDSVTMLFEDVEDIDFLGSFANCDTLLEDIRHLQPDIVIMDIDMPGMNGIDAVKMIRKNAAGVQVVMLTAFDDVEKVFAAIKAGADGYLLKNTDPQKLPEYIRQVYNGGAPMTPGIARKVLQQFQQDLSQREETNFNLSVREKEVLGLLVQGLSYKMIADKLDITYDTVRAHMKKIYEKLHVFSMTEAVAKALKHKLY